MKHTIRFIILFLVFVIGHSNAWAITDDDIIINIQPNNTAGTVTKSVSGMTVTINATPAAGYSIDAAHIIAEKMVNPSARRRVQGLAPSLPVTDNGGNSFSFTIPDGYDGAYVTVNFFKTTTDFTKITSLSQIPNTTEGLSGSYEITADIDASGFDGLGTFTGKLDGGLHKIYNLSEPLFSATDGAIIRNITFEDVNISETGNVGAVTREAKGASRIYNMGILSGSVGGTEYTGGLVGKLDGTARVINCYSYANITGGSDVGGIVGYNNGTTTASNIQTMVMNCMFYGDITGGTTVSPVYGGKNINNLQGGLNTFNYYAYEKLKTKAITEGKYNCALAVEEKYLNRFEFYRLLLNSNKKLAAFYATGSHADANLMAKWVLETADRTIDTPKPYPVLKAQGYYPSIINPDFENAPDSASVGRNHGGKLGKTLSVTISGVGSNAPSGASITKGSLTLQRTDKDFYRFNFNYDKVQLPYYNDVGTGNYTGNRVVTGWKITAITAVANDPYTSANYDYTQTYSSNAAYFDYPNYNFADRKSSKKDLYSVSGRVFSQGAYFDVPYGVSSITIEPYWGKACYIADQNYDVVYKNDYTGKQNVSQTGTQVTVGTTKFNGQNVQKSIEPALNYIANDLGGLGSTVYDNALVLVGNLHLDVVPLNGNRPFTMMSVDTDNDHEPDYSLIYHHKNRSNITPIRFDFLTVPGTAQAQKPNGASLICNFTIFKTRGWFEVTNTAFMYSSQIEYENGALYNKDEDVITKIDAPLILLGGVFDQFVSTQSSTVDGHTIYIHVGSNVWINSLGLGTHSDGSRSTPHVPVSVTGGEYEGFYLTGTYNANATVKADNAECYISGGHFAEAAGASLEQINGNVRWQIYNADIDNFFGGGINDAKPVLGNITTDIFNSNVTLFCGGPKFGNMQGTKTVTTYAEGCTFGKYFGAGYGGTSLSKKKYYDTTTTDWDTWAGKYVEDRGKYFDGKTTPAPGKAEYGKKGVGVATDLDYEFFVWSSGATGGRFYVKFASFSLAQCNDVSSTLKKCTVETNFYGGGNLGKVVGTATSELEDCIVKGNVYGAGYSASLPTVEVRDAGFTKNPNYNSASGMFEPATLSGTTTFTWQNAAAAGKSLENGKYGSDLDNHILYTDVTLENLGEVKATNLTIKGTTTVGESVYGGGEESGVGGNTSVTVNSGRIGVENTGRFGYRWGNVYGGGKGKIDDETASLTLSTKKDLDAGIVKGNTNVTINGTVETTQILHNVYGGGAIGSVGTFTRDNTTGMPTACAANTGLATVTINGGKIGHDHPDTGMVGGSSRGWEGDPNGEGAFAFLDQLAWVNNTIVTVGDATSSTEDKGPTIFGSVYGGGENGHNFENAVVTVNKGTVGYDKGTWDCGNIYGAGCGTDTFERDDNDDGEVDEGESDHHNPMAGLVRGTTSITINGGHVLRNVYGGGSMGSVGTYTYDGNGLPTTCAAGTGNTTININGGTIGADDSEYGNVYGGPKGNLNEREFSASVRETEVNINPHPTDTSKPGANVKGSVFGGGEAGIVKEKVVVNMLGGTVERDVYGGGALANTNTDVSDDASAKTLDTKVNLHGGTINRNVYGGGLGRQARAGKDAVGTEGQEDYEPAVEPLSAVEAKVKGDVLVELNGKKVIGEGGTEEWPDNCVVKGDIFGCNNLNGSPQHAVTVHIFKTVGYEGHEGTASDKMDSSNKADHTYHVSAVYGGGNLAAFMPDEESVADSVQARVIIDGCDMTSIRQVYGGGNAASAPATNITVNGTYEIEEVFGGGNGLDDITINDVTMANPGANVGYKNYSTYDSEHNVWNDNADADTKEERQAQNSPYVYGTGIASINIYDGRIHRVFGGSNTKGNVRKTAVTLLDDMGGCHFCIDEAYGGGKSASMDAEAQLLMACIPGLNAVYGGAEEADINDNVTLNITNGTFKRVFGGNNLSGTIRGSITVNVEETGCRPVVIGELYGGGNQAGYSVYGYKEVTENGEKVWRPRESDDDSGTGPATPYDDPQVNVKSFTSIGAIYGGGYGSGATMVGNPTVSINEVVGKFATTGENSSDYDEDGNYKGKTITVDDHEVDLPPHATGKIGAIGKVFGGGNAAMVMGNTHVNVATQGTIDFVTKDRDDTTGTQPRTEVTVQGADIRGNVYGGGNAAEVTGDANVVIGKSEPTPSPNPTPTPPPYPSPEP